MAGDRVIYRSLCVLWQETGSYTGHVEEIGTFDNDRHYMCMSLLPVKQT